MVPAGRRPRCRHTFGEPVKSLGDRWPLATCTKCGYKRSVIEVRRKAEDREPPEPPWWTTYERDA